MSKASTDLMDEISKAFWTVLFSSVPAVLLGMDFGFAIGLAYFVIASALLSIHYDIKASRKALQQNLDRGKQ